MNTALRFLLVLLFNTSLACAQDPTPASALDQQFTSMLNNVTLTGRWCLVRDGQLTEERDESYTIVSVKKGEGDQWIVNAQLKYQGQAIVAPIPVRVQWVAGAAVMIVENLTVPGGGTYSARVLFQGQSYTGTWSGGAKTGFLHGLIKPTGAR